MSRSVRVAFPVLIARMRAVAGSARLLPDAHAGGTCVFSPSVHPSARLQEAPVTAGRESRSQKGHRIHCPVSSFV